MNGLHYSDTLAGRVFSQVATPLGLAIPIYTATAIAGAGVNSMPLWNPPTSNRNVELVSVDIDYGSGTAAYGSVVLMAVPVAGIVSGSPCTAFATSVPMNGLLGGGQATKCWSYNGASSVTVTAGTAGAPSTTAAGPVRSIGSINLEAQTGTAHGTGIQTYDFKGTIIVPPGWMVYYAATLASVALYCCTSVWKEMPINPAGG